MSLRKALVSDVYNNAALGIIPEVSSAPFVGTSTSYGGPCGGGDQNHSVVSDEGMISDDEQSDIKVKEIIANVILGDEIQDKGLVPESSVIGGVTSVFPGIVVTPEAASLFPTATSHFGLKSATSQFGLNTSQSSGINKIHSSSHRLCDKAVVETEKESKNRIECTNTSSKESLPKQSIASETSSRSASPIGNEDTKSCRAESPLLLRQCRERICDQVVCTNPNSSKVTQNNNIIRDDDTDSLLEEDGDSTFNVSMKKSSKCPPLLRSQSLPAYSDRWPTKVVGTSPTTIRAAVSQSKTLTHQSSVISDVPDSGVYSERLGTVPSEGTTSPKSIRSARSARSVIKKKHTDQARTTIMQHYYPEGGWGWVIVIIATAVQLLNHGLHTSYGAMFGIVAAKFIQQPTAT
ncbi:unnamed protein product, partial [Meganyctiphanes norvegica]